MWPAALDAAKQPFRSATWAAALAVVVDRDCADLTRTRRLGPARFEHAVCREISRQGKQKPCLRIARALFTALADPAGVSAHRVGALERVALLLGDWRQTQLPLAQVRRDRPEGPWTRRTARRAAPSTAAPHWGRRRPG